MNNIFILEPIYETTNADNRLFFWASALNQRGYKVEQIWESCDDVSKGITLSNGVAIMHDYSTETIYMECDPDHMADEVYIKLIGELISLR